jgi:uncharacterized membrane protein
MPPQFGAGGTQPVEALSATAPIGFGWNVVIKRFGSVGLPIALGGFIATLPTLVIVGIMFGISQAAGPNIDAETLGYIMMAIMGLASLVLVLFSFYMAGGFITLALKAARGQQTGFGDLFSGGRFLGRFFVMSLVSSIVVGIGLALCVVPGYILLYGLSLAAFLIVDQDLSGVDALKRSWEMTKGHKVTIFLYNLLMGLVISLAGSCGLGLFIAMPMLLVGNAYVYLRIKGENPQAPT